MTKLFAIAGLVLFFSSDLMALKKAEGYYISAKTGKKYTTTFLIPVPFLKSKPDYERMQKEITYLVDDQKKTLSPEMISEFSFTYKGETVLMRSVHNNLARWNDGDLVFFKVIVDGPPVSLYNYYETRMTQSMGPTGAMTMTSTQYMRLVLQRDNGELVKIRRLFFKKDASEFFADCSDVVARIQSGQLSSLEDIVKAYNDTCTKNQ
jgi:hypothetical protein